MSLGGIDRSSHHVQARDALDAGDTDRARDQIDRAERQSADLTRYSIRWIADAGNDLSQDMRPVFK